MHCSQRASCFLTAALLLVVVTTFSCSSPFSITDKRGRGDDVAGGKRDARVLSKSVASENPSLEDGVLHKQSKIQVINTPYLQDEGDWMQPGKGISMCLNGEPKSGTTWSVKIVTELALHLCGSPMNTWCQMGGLTLHHHRPAPSYEWEMLHANTGELFMHFNGNIKHKMVGIDVEGCNSRGRTHRNSFEKNFPCRTKTKERTRESLYECLPDMSERCAELRPSRDPADLRTCVVFRDPRDVVISEHRMRIEVYKQHPADLNDFIYERFEAIVSWQYYRWMWHTTYYKNASHIVIYEDIKSKPEALVDLATFMGLNASLEEMQNVQEMERDPSPHGDYNTYNLPLETLEYMNTTMSKLSPEELLARYGLSPDFR